MVQREERLVCAATFAVAYKLVNDTCRYILVYPQGCDVCNHLSLFLCVADYDKLLPGEVPLCMLTRLQQTTMHDQQSCCCIQSLIQVHMSSNVLLV